MRFDASIPLRAKGFAIFELLCVGVLVLAIGSLVAVRVRHLKEQSEFLIDLRNMRELMAAHSMYATDNNDHLAHPTWGTLSIGPDGWAYATRNRRMLPNIPPKIPDLTGQDANSVTQQVPFFRIGLSSFRGPLGIRGSKRRLARAGSRRK